MACKGSGVRVPLAPPQVRGRAGIRARRKAKAVTMTADDPQEPAAQGRIACTPAAIRAVLAANGDSDTVRCYDADLDTAFERVRTNDDLKPLFDTVRRWWFEADTWRDPALASSTRPASAATSQKDHHRKPGVSAVNRSASGTASDAVFHSELDEPAEHEFAGLNQFATRALADLMDALVLVDPAAYQRRPGESTRAMRVLCQSSGRADAGHIIVTSM